MYQFFHSLCQSTAINESKRCGTDASVISPLSYVCSSKRQKWKMIKKNKHAFTYFLLYVYYYKREFLQ